MLLDLHTHILPDCDDGAKTVKISLELLKTMKSQGITTVVATPHFYPDSDTIDEFKARVSSAFGKLEKVKAKDLPEILIGCELFYFRNISKSEYIKDFTINNSNYILLEPNPYFIDKIFMDEILYLKNDLGLIPIIPHIERYYKAKGFKSFLNFIKENKILTQVNCASFFEKSYNRIIKKLFEERIVTFVATDSHSLNRPPMMSFALCEIENRFSPQAKQIILHNLNSLLNDITNKEQTDEIEQFKYL
jgi:protein-tyrosine phosphatase